MKDISPILKSLGLAESEIKVYLTALDRGAGTAMDLAKQSRVSRQGVYLAIEELETRGLMTSVVHGKKKLYSAEHPANLLDFAKRKQHEMAEQIGDLERAIPDLVLQMGGSKPIVKVYQGKEGIRAIIEVMKESGRNEFLEMTDLVAMNKVLTPEDLKPLRDTLFKLETSSKGLYFGELKTKPQPNVERYVLSEAYGNFKAHVTVYSDKVIFVTFGEKPVSVIIDSREVAQSMKVLFGLALEAAHKNWPKQ
jgi:sugar-specific transcriptional regulator TrmB